jgi:protein-S-isoprenylcysteine O-methyltransferase Ste14
MKNKKRTHVLGGLLLILIGAGLLAVQILPGFTIQFSWPWIVISVGLFLLALGAALGEPDMAIPACIVGGIGGILAFQNATGYWESWSYIWTLIPGFVGTGMVLANILGSKSESIQEGLWMMVISFALFVVFGSFFEAFGDLSKYWPVVLIVLGLIFLIRPLFQRD